MMTSEERGTTMGRKKTEKLSRDTCAGVSEIIGAILLVTLVVAAVGIVAVYLFSQQAPSKTPSLKFMTGVDSTKTTLYLYHNGGDSMTAGEFSVLLDSVPASYSVSDGSSQWSLGKNLVIPITTVPQRVQLVYNTSASGGSVMISQAAVNVVSSQNVSPDQLPYLDCSAVKNWDCRYQIPPEIIVDRYLANSSTKKINFMRAYQAVGTVIGGVPTDHFNFTVSKPNSTIHIATLASPNCNAGDYFPLVAGDKVGITFNSNPTYFVVEGGGSQIWELSAGAASSIRTTITYAINGTTNTFNQRTICHAYITEYSTLDSTIDLTTTTTNRVTSLIVNETHEIDGLDSTTIKLVDISPLANGQIFLSAGASNTPIIFTGWAKEIQYGGVIQDGLGL